MWLQQVFRSQFSNKIIISDGRRYLLPFFCVKINLLFSVLYWLLHHLIDTINLWLVAITEIRNFGEVPYNVLFQS